MFSVFCFLFSVLCFPFHISWVRAGAGPKKRKPGVTKRDKEIAQAVHRSHLLCLLARMLLLDSAAADPLLQARP